MTGKGRLLDLALAYALDNEAIHQNDPDNVTALREMQTEVLDALRNDIEPVIIAPVQVFAHEQIAAMMNDGTVCTRPPAGWTCSRGDGHDGPCAPLAQRRC